MFDKTPLTPQDSKTWEECLKARETLTDSLTDLDNALAEKVIALDSIQEVTAEELKTAIRRSVISQVLCEQG